MSKFMGFVQIVRINMKINLDRIAISLSAFCALHCVIIALIAGLLPLLFGLGQHGHGVHDFLFHQIILFLILPISLPALWFGYRQHRQLLPIVISAIGLLLLVIVTAFIDDLIHQGLLALEYETFLTLAGGIIHAIGHWLNLKATSRASCVKPELV